METETNMLRFDPDDLGAMIKLMDAHEEYDTMLFGKNEEDEQVTIHINEDHIITETWQANGWIRKNIYWRDGTREELFTGKEEHE